MGFGDGDDKSDKADGSHARKRSLYRQGSLSSQFSGEVQEVMVPLKDDSGSITGSYRSVRKRTPSGKSIISRTVSVAEYHEELKKDIPKKVTFGLLFQSFVILFGNSFLFGYNIGVLNQPTDLIKEFFNKTYMDRGSTMSNGTTIPGEPLNDYTITLLFSVLVAMYFPGGMIGAFSAGFMADKLGRKKSVLLGHIPCFIAAILQFICVYTSSPEILIVGRFIQGLNCGLASQFAPMYLTEITPFNLRGAFGTAHQLFVTIGIFLGSVFGLSSLLGKPDLWPVLLLFNAIPALFSLVTLPFLWESPRYLLIAKNDRSEAEKALQFLRGTKDVQIDIEEMDTEDRLLEDADFFHRSVSSIDIEMWFGPKKLYGNGGNTATSDPKGEEGQAEEFTMMRLLTTPDLRMPLIITVILQVAQQFSGINGIFFYSTEIFKAAGVEENYIEYAVMGTNLLNVAMTIITVPIMDLAGRRPLLLFPMIIMTVDMAVITVALHFQESVSALSYLGIVCVLAYVVCFAIGLGPIPLMTGAELFRQAPRSKAMAIAGLTNWLCTTIIAIIFPILQKAIKEYIFILFLILMVGFTLFVWLQVPETKNKTFEEIANLFQPGGQIEVEEYMEDEDFVDIESKFDGASGDVFTEGTKLMNEENGPTGKKYTEKNGTGDLGDVPEEKRALTKSEEKLHENV